MLAKRIQPMVFQARRLYVELMFQVMGRALQAVSEVDEKVQNEARALPDGFLFEMFGAGSHPQTPFGSGGRYDGLVGMFSKKAVPSVCLLAPQPLEFSVK